MSRAISLAEHVEEIRLAPPDAGGGAVARGLRRLSGLAHRRHSVAGSLRATDSALTVRAAGPFEGGAEIPWRQIRKLVIDDGTRWGYVSGVCRFPVYDLRPDGSGSGVLIGPLWSSAPASLMPDGSPKAELAPVPAEAPNVAILFDPPLAISGDAHHDRTEPISILLLRVEDPDAARGALAARAPSGDLGHEELEYLSGAARGPVGRFSAGRTSAASA